ncbi:retrovirus-related pol polyprotein from transposon TNT 1-94 [Tanacetum coccineum]
MVKDQVLEEKLEKIEDEIRRKESLWLLYQEGLCLFLEHILKEIGYLDWYKTEYTAALPPLPQRVNMASPRAMAIDCSVNEASSLNLMQINWVVGTGASDHMFPHLHLFQCIRILKEPIRIKLPDGTCKWVTKVGKIRINDSLTLTDVFYVPDFKVNLLFVGKLLITQQLIAIFFPTWFMFQDPSTRQVLAAGEGFHNLYICKPYSPKPSPDSFPILSFFVNKVVQNKSNDVTIDLFHSRLGHTSVSKLIRVHDCKNVNVSHFFYDTCMLAKHHRLPFSLSQTRSKVPLELIHFDLWGPYKISALNGAHYFLTIVDNNTRCTWTYLIHTKDHIHDTLSLFFYIRNHYNVKTKFIRSDNGTEIVNKACLALFCSLGIVHQKSMVYTPQQNRVVDRKHKHLLDTAKAIKLHANLPKMGVIGCLCYAAVTKPHKDKFDPRRNRSQFQNPLPASSSQPWTVYEEDEEQVPASQFVPTNQAETQEELAYQAEPIIQPKVLPQQEHAANNPRRSSRSSNKPSWLKDFVTPKASMTCSVPNTKQPVYPLFPSQDFESYPKDYVALLAHVLNATEPTTYKQVALDAKWVAAMNKELQALEDNETWVLTSLPPNHKAISSKWVFETKYNLDGTVERLKERLVIRGFDQKEGTNYKHKFSPFTNVATVRVLIAIATAKDWPMHQLDVNNAFLYGYVEEEVYIKPPEGYSKALPGQVIKLSKSLYGLKQASRQWNQELSKFLNCLGFV